MGHENIGLTVHEISIIRQFAVIRKRWTPGSVHASFRTAGHPRSLDDKLVKLQSASARGAGKEAAKPLPGNRAPRKAEWTADAVPILVKPGGQNGRSRLSPAHSQTLIIRYQIIGHARRALCLDEL